MWLPTWVGMNTRLIDELDKHLSKMFVNKVLSDALLDEAHHEVIRFLEKRFPQVEGMFDFLDSIKFVNAHAQEAKVEGTSASAGEPAVGG